MHRSIRARLLLWFAGMLLLVIASFACYLYWSTELAGQQQLDVRLEGAVRYLDASVKSFPLREWLKPVPYGPPPFGPGALASQGRPGFKREFSDTRPFEKRPSDKRRDGEPRSADGERRDGNRNMNALRESAERLKRSLILPSPAENDAHKTPLFFTIYKENGTVFKAWNDPVPQRDFQQLAGWLAASNSPVYHDYDATRLALFRGPEKSLILVGVPMTQELARLDTLLYQLIASGALALLMGLVGSWYISGMIMRPLKTISATASNLSAARLHERIDASRVDAELVELATVLNGAFDRLEEAFQRQSRFTSDAGHELRTPLAVLHTNLELALARPRSEEEYRLLIESCRESSGKMRSLIDSLLMLSRADAGQLQANFREIDLRQTVSAVLEQKQPQARHLSLEACLPAGPVPVRGDAMLLGMVLTNLVGNALRYTPPQGRILVKAALENDRAILSVSDTGTGIPADALPHIFERFYRVDQSRNSTTGGYGLGLAICQSLIEAHHGTITCQSETGTGTTFTIVFPRTQHAAQASAEHASAEHARLFTAVPAHTGLHSSGTLRCLSDAGRRLP